MPDNDAPDHPVALPLDGPRLTHHFPDGLCRHKKIVLCSRKPGRQGRIRVFQIRQIDVHQSIQLPQSLGPLVAPAVIHHRHRKPGRQSREDRRQKMGGRYQIDIFRALGNQLFHALPQSGAVHRRAHRGAADGGILTIFAAQRTASKENGAAAAASRQSGFFPLVEHGLGHQSGIRTAAEAPLTGGSVHAAAPGT